MEVQNRVMVIDDDEITRKSLKKILEEEGYETETAKTGREGVEKIRKKFFNITLLDIKLPDVEGTELLLPLKEMRPDMNIIMITGNSEKDSAIKALNRGAAAYILKPLDIDCLLGCIRGFIEKQCLIAEKRQVERELKESFEDRKELENIINKSPAVVFLWKNKEGWPVEYVSENIKQFGYTPEEFYSGELPYSNIIHPDDLERVAAEVNMRSIEGVQEFEQEYRIITKNNDVCWIDDHTWIRRNQKGEITHYQGIILDITERKKTEEKLKISKEKYRLITENVSNLIIVINQKFECEYVNENVSKKIWGYTSNDLIGKSLRNSIHPDDLNTAIISFRKGVKGGEGEVVLRVRKKDGHYAWFDITGKRFFDEKGERKALFISRDVTARKEAEAKLKESEEKYRFVSENANDIISVFDNNMNLIFINEKYQKISGFSQHEVVGKTAMRFVHPDDYSQTLKEFKKLIRNGAGSVEFRMRCKDNSYIWVEANGKILIDDESRELKMLLVTRDIDKRKKLELKLKESERKYRLITENANDLIFIMNRNAITEFINEEVFKKILGYTNDDLIGKPALNFIHSEDIEKTKKLIRIGFKAGEGTAELRCIDKNGFFHWLEIRGKTIIDQDGKTKGLLIARVITERKKREEELEETHSKLNQIFNITIPLCEIDKKFNLIRINNTFSSMFNVKREEIIGRKCYDIIPGPLCNTPECTMRQILGGKDHWDYEKDLELANESKIVCNMRAVPYRGPDGEIIGVIQNYTDITERKKIEDMLKLNKERYSLATNAAKVGVWDWNLENGEFYLDPNIKTMLGYSDEEIPNDLDVWVTYIHPDDSKGVMEAAQAHLEGKTSEYIYQHRMLHKDGSFRWIQVRGRAIRDTQGNAIRMIGTDVDITALKKVEKAIQKRNREFSALLEASRAVLEHKDFKTSSRAIFNSCARLIGTTDGFIGLLTPDKKTIQVLSLNMHGTTREAELDLIIPIRGLLADVLSSKKVKYHNNLSNSKWKNNLQLPGGHIELKNVMFTPLIINDIVEGLMGLANKPGGFNEDDAKLTTAFVKIATMALINSQILESLEKSEQKYRQLSNMLEEKVEERTQELKKSEEKIQNLINNISDVLMEGDIDGTITFISPQIYDIIGHQPKELIGIKFLELIHSEEKLIYEKLINITPKAGSKTSMELRILHKKGYYVPISIKGSTEEINNKLKIFVVISDITEKRKIDEMMNSEIKKLKELDQIRSDLIRRISHELKTPLISIFSGSQYLLEHSNDKFKDQTQSIIQLIHMGGYRLKSLVDNLILTYSIESNELNLNLKRENIIQIIKNCIEDIVFQAKKRQIFISIELLKELYIEVDKSTIKRAISNIISNAVKNTPTNGNIFVSTFEHPNYIDIIVKDDGVGLTEKEKLLLFKRFGKIERYGKGMDVDIEGAGLGLYIANEIVKLHNGEIIVKSKGRNKGSTFIIRLSTN